MCHEADGGNSLAITQPQDLKAKFGDNNGLITERPSLFGMPPYGRTLRGQLFWPSDETEALGCDKLTEVPVNPASNPLVYVFVRGQCTFVKKVRNAQEAGATAVIVVNNDDGELPHMANDGSGGSIMIPSMIISKKDGDVIHSYLNNPDRKGVVVEVSIEYGLPESKVVDYTLWTSALDPQALDFKQTFGDIAELMEAETRFSARYFVVNGTSYGCDRETQICGNQCTNHGRYCAVDPDHDLGAGVSGADVVQENLRQMCVFDIASGDKKTYLWWKYVNEFRSECALRNQVNEECFRRAAHKVPGLSIDRVLQCVSDSGPNDEKSTQPNSRLELELKRRSEDGVYLMPTVMINNVTYFGDLSCPAPLDMAHCGVLNTICTAFVDGLEPLVCYPSKGCPLGQTRDACDRCLLVDSPDFIRDSSKCERDHGVSFFTVLALIVVFVALLIGAAFVYHRHSSSQMRDELRNIMSQYVPLEGDNDNVRLVPPRPSSMA